jgi:hypothetical protein
VMDAWCMTCTLCRSRPPPIERSLDLVKIVKTIPVMRGFRPIGKRVPACGKRN